METPFAAALISVLALAMVHLFAGALNFLGGIPRSRWLSIAGGISVAYVLVHLLPELSKGQEAVEEAACLLPFLERHVYLMALLGLAVFYGVERSARRAKHGSPHAERPTTGRAFWLSVVSFAVYNAVIGYLLVHREDDSLSGLVLFSVALGVHFVVNDFGLRERHREAYVRVGRRLLAAGILAGWAVGELTEISEAAIALLIGFLAGGVILNVMKEELPQERQSRFYAFAAGATGYAALLIAV